MMHRAAYYYHQCNTLNQCHNLVCLTMRKSLELLEGRKVGNYLFLKR